MADLPTGTVTFLFTDVEGSTRLWEQHPDEMRLSLRRHDAILREAVDAHHGVVFSTMGDGLAAAFQSAADAVTAALAAQQRLGAVSWGDAGPLRVRMGLHTDEARLRDPDEYINQPLNRCARLMAAGHGGQALLSGATAALVRDRLPPGTELVDLGEHRLRDLAAPLRIFQLAHPGLQADFPGLRSLEAISGNLPRQVTTFVGREDELTTLAGLLRERPIVTLTGVGGVGKTRLAVQAAAELGSEFPDGAWLTELAPVTDANAIWEALALSVGVQPGPGQRVEDTVLAYLCSKHLLLVLDNCEHLLAAAARAVDAITQRCRHVSVLVTSREGLAIPGECLVAVPALGVPPADAPAAALERAEAVRLFIDRARDAKSDFDPTESDLQVVAQLCRRLDGIPLAIELAAARVQSLTAQDLVSRLDQRFKLLTRGSRAALERHQTLRNTIDWSYDLLTETERELLNHLSVFACGCDLAASEAVLVGETFDALDVVALLGQLVDKSLVIVDDDGPAPRYRLLETIRQYAQERLEETGDASATRHRHADHYLAVAEAAAVPLRSRDQTSTARSVARDRDNFRAAFDWAAETPSTDHALRIVASLAVDGVAVGYAAMDWASAAIELPGGSDHVLFPAVASWAAWDATMRGDLERAGAVVEALDRAEASLGTRDPAACQGPCTFAFFGGDAAAARRRAEEWVARARAAGDPYELANALIMQASALQAEDPDMQIHLLEEAVHIARDAGITSALAIGLAILGGALMGVMVRSPTGPDVSERALEVLNEAIVRGSDVGDRQSVATATGMRGTLGALRGDWRAALQASADTAGLQLELGALVMVPAACAGAAVALAELGRLEPATVLLGAAGPKSERFGPDWWIEMMTTADAKVSAVLGEDRTAALLAEGARMSASAAVEYLQNETQRDL